MSNIVGLLLSRPSLAHVRPCLLLFVSVSLLWCEASHQFRTYILGSNDLEDKVYPQASGDMPLELGVQKNDWGVAGAGLVLVFPVHPGLCRADVFIWKSESELS